MVAQPLFKTKTMKRSKQEGHLVLFTSATALGVLMGIIIIIVLSPYIHKFMEWIDKTLNY